MEDAFEAARRFSEAAAQRRQAKKTHLSQFRSDVLSRVRVQKTKAKRAHAVDGWSHMPPSAAKVAAEADAAAASELGASSLLVHDEATSEPSEEGLAFEHLAFEPPRPAFEAPFPDSPPPFPHAHPRPEVAPFDDDASEEPDDDSTVPAGDAAEEYDEPRPPLPRPRPPRAAGHGCRVADFTHVEVSESRHHRTAALLALAQARC
ncbi:hypothetical protein M885DRAFT_560439 [Pelagophyceae sp. CCMP2097]|nr:hypothetical protein M885DRAFT_560439 [Pelagophyceae sp. CCMP2097]